MEILSAIITPPGLVKETQLPPTLIYPFLKKSIKIKSKFSFFLTKSWIISMPFPKRISALMLFLAKLMAASSAIFSSTSIVVSFPPSLPKMQPLYPLAVPSSRIFFGLNFLIICNSQAPFSRPIMGIPR